MDPLFILLIIIVLIGAVGYFLTLGVFNLLKTIVENTKGGLPGIYAFLVILSCTYAGINQDKAPEYLEHLQFWKDEIPSDESVYNPWNN